MSTILPAFSKISQEFRRDPDRISAHIPFYKEEFSTVNDGVASIYDELDGTVLAKNGATYVCEEVFVCEQVISEAKHDDYYGPDLPEVEEAAMARGLRLLLEKIDKSLISGLPKSEDKLGWKWSGLAGLETMLSKDAVNLEGKTLKKEDILKSYIKLCRNNGGKRHKYLLALSDEQYMHLINNKSLINIERAPTTTGDNRASPTRYIIDGYDNISIHPFPTVSSDHTYLIDLTKAFICIVPYTTEVEFSLGPTYPDEFIKFSRRGSASMTFTLECAYSFMLIDGDKSHTMFCGLGDEV